MSGEGQVLKPAELVLLEEACRAADRLDTLDRILRGDEQTWLRLVAQSLDGAVVEVRVQGVLAEVRQQQIALKQLLGELRQSRATGGLPKASGGATRPSAPKEGAGDVPAGVTSLAARIAAKRGNQTAG